METPEITQGSSAERNSRSKEFIKEAVEQPALTRIAELRAKSSFTRSEEGTAAAKLRNKEGFEYSIKTVESGKDPVLDDVQQLFEDTFSAEEVDPVETLKNAVDGVTESGTLDVAYRVVPVQNENGELMATMAGGTLEMKNGDEPSDEMVYFVGYAVTAEQAQGQGLAKEAYVSALTDAMEIAKKQGNKLSFAVGECTASSEYYWNSVGWKRVYARQPGSAEYTELPYIQPVLEFDPATGRPAEGAGEVPEHLMIDGFNRTPSKEDIKRAHAAFVLWNSAYPREEFDSDEAFETKEAYIRGILEQFDAFLDQSEDLMFMDAATRGKIRENGFKINDLYVPDSETADPEDERF